MKRLRYLILFFFLALSLPLTYVIWLTLAGLGQEEEAQLKYFSESLFDDIEGELTELIRREENRSVEEYHHTLYQEGGLPRPSPLSEPPSRPYIIGYLQNNSDGTFQTPLIADIKKVPDGLRDVIGRLTEVNWIFNLKKSDLPAPATATIVAEKRAPLPAVIDSEGKKEETKKDGKGLTDRYLISKQKSAPKTYLGREQIKTEEITARQAMNLSADEKPRSTIGRRETSQNTASAPLPERSWQEQASQEDVAPPAPAGEMEVEGEPSVADSDDMEGDAGRFQVEVAPFQSLFITADQIFIFRRIAINNQFYRQGLIISISSFFDYLATNRFEPLPLSDFMTLRLQTMGNDRQSNVVRSGPVIAAPQFSVQRHFPAPFDFFSATLEASSVPASPARRPLSAAIGIIGVVMLAGLVAIYHSARTIVTMSERRNQFVSSVTHELKTPLTNIRMYIEMLEQGIAPTPQREQEYLQVLDTESARLSHLINNVLELAKLEKKQRRFSYTEGNLQDVLVEVKLIMSQKLIQEGFVLIEDIGQLPVFSYDREVLVQLLINLIENSIKFGGRCDLKQITISAHADEANVHIGVKDTGPGIPRWALKKIFTDFFRVDNELTRTTGGTGIGLALVKKFVDAMGGRISATNNRGAGCTISMVLPRRPT